LSIVHIRGILSFMRIGLAVIGFLLANSLLGADRLAELMSMHVEVVGGKEQIAALAAVRASGVIFLPGKRVKFTLTVARPNLLRLESEADGHKFLQAYDGVDLPWQFDSNEWPKRYRGMSDESSDQIMVDAEYDGPLISGQARGFKVTYVGETEVNGRKFAQLQVTWRLRQTFSLLLDPETYLIVYRVDTRPKGEGREESVTHYDDYRPVDGVLLPHEITTTVEGRVTDQMRIDRIEANPPINAGMFTRPDRAAVESEAKAGAR
jgi:hypothetical protein